MKQLTVISGKGGTGKTTLTAALASLSPKAILADCDVDAPDLPLLLQPAIQKTKEFVCGKRAQIDREACIDCGLCRENCRFEAITEKLEIDELSCEGCGTCAQVCPVQAIRLLDKVTGEWYVSKTRFGQMIHAQLGIGEDNSGKLVSQVRQEAREVSQSEKGNRIIIDGPPGIGCPVIAAITGTDYVLIVTEPTASAIHDLKRVVELIRHFGISIGVCVNKFDINLERTEEIRAYCNQEQLDFLGAIPHDPLVVTAMVNNKTIFEGQPGPAALAVKKIWDLLKVNLD